MKGAKDNRDAFHKLAADTCELVYVVLCMYEEVTKKGDDRGPSRKLIDDLQGLLGSAGYLGSSISIDDLPLQHNIVH